MIRASSGLADPCRRSADEEPRRRLVKTERRAKPAAPLSGHRKRCPSDPCRRSADEEPRRRLVKTERRAKPAPPLSGHRKRCPSDPCHRSADKPPVEGCLAAG